MKVTRYTRLKKDEDKIPEAWNKSCVVSIFKCTRMSELQKKKNGESQYEDLIKYNR